MTDPTPLLARMPPGATLHLHAVPPDDGHADYPAEVAIFRSPGTPGGCMVWALYDGVWHPNRGERYALRLLMGDGPSTTVRVPESLIAGARSATGLDTGPAVRQVLGDGLRLDVRVRAVEAENSHLWDALTDVAQVADELKARIEALEERR